MDWQCRQSYCNNNHQRDWTRFNLLCGPSGSQHFSHHKTNYTATYSISCNSDSKCTGCRRSGSLIVIDDKGKSSTSTEDCGKKYLSYEIRSAANGPSMVKCTSPSLNIHNTKEYMPVNTYSIYTTNSGKPKEYIERRRYCSRSNTNMASQ